jgi:hypothetical protein
LVDDRVFSAAIAMTLATTLLTPVALRALSRRRSVAPPALDEPVAALAAGA